MSSNQTYKLLPIQDAVEQATGRRFHRLTVHAWRRSEKLAATKIGQQWFCTVEDVRQMVARETEAAKQKHAVA